VGFAVGGSIPSVFYKPGSNRKGMYVVLGIDVVMVYCTPTLFAAWAYYELFTSPDMSNLAVVASLAVALVLVAIGVVQFYEPEAE